MTGMGTKLPGVSVDSDFLLSRCQLLEPAQLNVQKRVPETTAVTLLRST